MTPDALTEPQRRLLAEIGRQIAGERVRELHLFAPIRQGGVETGLAVVAAGEPVPPAEEQAERRVEERVEPHIEAPAGAPAAACDPTDAAAGPPPAAAPADDAAGEPDDEVAADLAEPTATAAPPADAALRFTIYTARYRLQLKGPDRGKWETEIVAEADAPLLTVDAVVRGVQRRAGELTAVERLEGAELQQLLAGAA